MSATLNTRTSLTIYKLQIEKEGWLGATTIDCHWENYGDFGRDETFVFHVQREYGTL